MSRKSARVSMFSWLLLFMLCSTFGLVLGLLPDYSYHSEEVLVTTDYSFDLTESSPFWVFQPSPITGGQATRQGISSLVTDGANVTVTFLSGGGDILASFFDVQKIEEVALVSYGARIIVTRQDTDVHVNLTVARWVEPMPPPVVIFWSPIPLMLSFFLAVLSLLMILRTQLPHVESLPTGITRLGELRRSIRPWWIVMLALLGALLINPYLIGLRFGYFTPVLQTEILDSGSIDVVLNESNPVEEIQISFSQYDSPNELRFSSFTGGLNEYHIELDEDSLAVLQLSHENSTVSWVIQGASLSGSTYTLIFERVDADVQVSCSYEIIGNYMRPLLDSFSTALLAALGIAMFAICFGAVLVIEENKSDDDF